MRVLIVICGMWCFVVSWLSMRVFRGVFRVVLVLRSMWIKLLFFS